MSLNAMMDGPGTRAQMKTERGKFLALRRQNDWKNEALPEPTRRLELFFGQAARLVAREVRPFLLETPPASGAQHTGLLISYQATVFL